MKEINQNFWNEAYKDDPDSVVVADQFLAQEVADLEPTTAVDLGCGSGINALMLAEKGWSVVGVDWAEEAVKLANAAAQNKGLDAHFLVGDSTNWQPPTQYDLVVSTYALPGAEDSKKVLATAVAALAPGGSLIIIEWDKSMAKPWGFAEDDLMSPKEIITHLPSLKIEKADIRTYTNPHGMGEDVTANVAVVRAHKTTDL